LQEGLWAGLVRQINFSDDNLKLAIIYGSTMASLAVEKFSLDGIRNLDKKTIRKRFDDFKKLTHFETVSI